MKAIRNYLLAMKGKDFSHPDDELCEYQLECANTMLDDLEAYIFSFNESERQREYEIIMNELWDKALYYGQVHGEKFIGGGLIDCLRSLQEDMSKRGFVCSLDWKISIINERMGNFGLNILRDPLLRSLYFDAEEEKTPGETTPQETPGETTPQETPGETIPQETPGETIPKKNERRPRGESILEAIIYENKEIALEVLKECLGGKKGVELAFLFEAAIKLKLIKIKERPSFRTMKEVLGVEGYENGFRYGYDRIHDVKKLSMQDSIFLESAMNILKETLDRKQNNHGNN